MSARSLALGVLLGAIALPAAAADEAGGARFTATAVADRVWRIDDHGDDNIYLVAGTEKALLIDTGVGRGDLLKVVRALTTLPLAVVVTHGHRDHAGGIAQFAKVHGHPEDLDQIRFHDTFEEGKKPVQLVPVDDGFVFDLGGGRRLTVVATPGHTRGSICLLASDLRILFTGDNDNPVQWQFLRESTTLDEYLRTLQALDARKDFETVLPGHGGALDKAYIGELAACVRSVLDGSCRDDPYQPFPGARARVCRLGRASVAFDPGRLR